MAVLPIFGLLVLPDSTFVYRTELYKNMTGKEPVQDERVVVIVARKETKLGELNNENVYPLGVSGYIKEISPQGLLHIRLVQRVHVDDITIQPERRLVITTSRCPDIEDMDEEAAKDIAGALVDAGTIDFSAASESAYGSISDSITVAEREFKRPPRAMRKFDGLRGEVK